jgi:hypothetical protein
MGNAFDPQGGTVEVGTLAEAKERFKLDNIALYGGGLDVPGILPFTRQ